MKYLRLPSAATSLVQTSWGTIPKEPVKIEGIAPEEILAMVPTTFKDMANFNNMVLGAATPERPDMTWVEGLMYPAMDALVGAWGDEARFKKECEDVASKLKAASITSDQATEFKALMLA